MFLEFDREGHNVFIKEYEVELKDCLVANVIEGRSNVFVIKMNMHIAKKDMTIHETISNVLSK